MGRGGAAHQSVQRTPRQYASIIFPGDRRTRLAGGERELQDVRNEHLGVGFVAQPGRSGSVCSSQLVDAFEVSAVQIALRESLLAAHRHRICRCRRCRLDIARELGPAIEHVQEDPGGSCQEVSYPIYSGTSHGKVGVSARTLTMRSSATGASACNCYLRLCRRLWLRAEEASFRRA